MTADLEESEADFQDELVKQFQKTIRDIKTDRKMGERYMIFEEMLREEKQEGRQEGRLEGRLEATREAVLALLEDIGEVPDRLRDKVGVIDTLEDLKVLHKIAARADSFPVFEEEMDTYLQSKEKHE